MKWKQQLQIQLASLKSNLKNNGIILMRIWSFGFLDIIGRYSFHHLGLWGYAIRFIVNIISVSLLVYDLSKVEWMIRRILGISLTLTAWGLLMLNGKLEKQSSEFSVSMFFVHGHVQLMVTFASCLICCVNSARRFVAYINIFLLFGVILNFIPQLLCEIFIMSSIFLYTVAFLDYFENGFGFSEEEIIYYFGKEEDNKRKMMQIMQQIRKNIFELRFEFILYLLLMVFTSIGYYITVLGTDPISGASVIILSSLGSSGCTLMAAIACISFFNYFGQKIVSVCQIAIKKDDNAPNYSAMISLCSFALFCDLFVRDVDHYERGNLFVRRALLFLIDTMKLGFIVIETASFKYDVLRGNLFTTVRVVILHVFYIIFSMYIVNFALIMYSMDDVGISWMMAQFYAFQFNAVVSILLFFLHKYESVRDDFWENFDDIVFYIRLFDAIISVIINIIATCFGIWAIFYEHYYLEDVIRLISLSYTSIFIVITTLKRDLERRREILRFTSNLEEATKDRINENNDCCPICFQEMKVAKVTPCSHLFHEICLRKCLNTKPVCPKCTSTLYQQA